MLLTRALRKIMGMGHRWGFGVQSPYAYNFVKILFQEDKALRKLDKQTQLITKIRKSCKEEIAIFQPSEYDKIMQYVNTHTDNTLVIVKDIYCCRENYRNWKKLLPKDSIRMTFDLYYIGVLAIRKGLYKKDFIINY